jgi:hypothetical protein
MTASPRLKTALTKNFIQGDMPASKKSEMVILVIPVKTGIQFFKRLPRIWIPACEGMTTLLKSTRHNGMAVIV